MEAIGINVGVLLVQLISVALVAGLPIVSLIDLSKKKLSGAPLAIWASKPLQSVSEIWRRLAARTWRLAR